MEAKPFFSIWYVRVLVLAVLAAGTIALGMYAYASYKAARYNYGPTTISVHGEGEVLAKPDVGSFSFSVRAEGKDAGEAQSKSAESINAIMGFLKESGVEEKDIKNTNYYLSPKYSYEYDMRPCAYGYCPPSEPKIDGYEVTQTITVKVRDLSKTGTLVSGVGERGATDMSSLEFTIDDSSTLKAQAREKAIADAREKAKVLADNLDVRLGRMVSFWENQDSGYPMPLYGMGGAEMAMSKDMAIPEMPTGESSTMVTVDITYEIR